MTEQREADISSTVYSAWYVVGTQETLLNRISIIVMDSGLPLLNNGGAIRKQQDKVMPIEVT